MLQALILAVALLPHGGGLDSLGCHRDRKQGGYHCHQGPLADRSFASKAEALEALRKHKPNQSTALKGPWRTVTRVVDGDTIILNGRERVRLIGVDTPETVDPRRPVQYFGKEASAFTRNLLREVHAAQE